MKEQQEKNINELQILIKYLVNHNEEHTSELEELANQLVNKNQEEAYQIIQKAIISYKEGNELLKEALNHIEVK